MPEVVTGSVFGNECDFDLGNLETIAAEFIEREFGKSEISPWNAPACYASWHDSEFFRIDGELVVYVTGFTPALVALINVCRKVGMSKLTLMHFDRNSGEYVPQNVAW